MLAKCFPFLANSAKITYDGDDAASERAVELQAAYVPPRGTARGTRRSLETPQPQCRETAPSKTCRSSDSITVPVPNKARSNRVSCDVSAHIVDTSVAMSKNAALAKGADYLASLSNSPAYRDRRGSFQALASSRASAGAAGQPSAVDARLLTAALSNTGKDVSSRSRRALFKVASNASTATVPGGCYTLPSGSTSPAVSTVGMGVNIVPSIALQATQNTFVDATPGMRRTSLGARPGMMPRSDGLPSLPSLPSLNATMPQSCPGVLGNMSTGNKSRLGTQPACVGHIVLQAQAQVQ